jgi:arylsulfatase
MTIPHYPFQEGSSLKAAGNNYRTLKAVEALKRLREIETIFNPHD